MSGGNQNSLDNLIGLFGDLGANLDILSKETPEIEMRENIEDVQPLGDLIKGLEEHQEFFNNFQYVNEKPITDVLEIHEGLEDTLDLLTSEDTHYSPERAKQVSSSIVGNILDGIQVAKERLTVDLQEQENIFEGPVEESKDLIPEDDGFLLTYVDVIILISMMLGFIFILSVICILFNYCMKCLTVRRNWRNLSQSETNSSVSWISINTTSTEDTYKTPINDPVWTPVKTRVQTPVKSSVKTHVQTPVEPPVKTPVKSPFRTPVKTATIKTARLSPIPCVQLEQIPNEYVLDSTSGLWYGTEVSTSILV